MTRDALGSALGGPNALTKWTWVVAFPLGLASGTLWGMREGLTLQQWAPIVLAVQVILSVILICMRQGLLLAQNRTTSLAARIWLAVLSFALLGGLRVVIIIGAGIASGLDVSWQTVWQLVPHGMASGIGILGIVAVVVDGSRRHATAMQHLGVVDAQLATTRAFDEAGLATIETNVTDEVTRALRVEIDALRQSIDVADGDASAQVSGALRGLAADLVRPLSHQIAHDDPWMPDAPSVPAGQTRFARIKAMVAQVRPAWPLIPVLLIALMGLPSEAVESAGGPGFGAVNVILACMTLYAGMWLLDQLWPKTATTPARLASLLVVYLGIGALAMVQMFILGSILAGDHRIVWITPVTFAVTALGVSLLAAVDVQWRGAEDELAHSIVRNAELSMQVRERAIRVQRRVAKFLHSDVQAELIATAMLLASWEKEEMARGERAQRIGAALEGLASTLGQRVRDEDDIAVSSRERLVELSSLWAAVLDLEVEVMDDVWPVLDTHRDVAAAIDDIVAEGLTNAVRHGDSPKVKLAMRIDGERVAIDIHSTGSLSAGRGTGLGSHFLADAADSWQLEERNGMVCLSAAVGVSMRGVNPRPAQS